jgi:hypothetical protein
MTLTFPDGKWWASRNKRGVEPDGMIEVFLFTDGRGLSDERYRVGLRGTPEMLDQVARAIKSQVASAKVNDEEEVA